jgi:hypothetical protein
MKDEQAVRRRERRTKPIHTRAAPQAKPLRNVPSAQRPFILAANGGVPRGQYRWHPRSSAAGCVRSHSLTAYPGLLLRLALPPALHHPNLNAVLRPALRRRCRHAHRAHTTAGPTGDAWRARSRGRRDTAGSAAAEAAAAAAAAAAVQMVLCVGWLVRAVPRGHGKGAMRQRGRKFGRPPAQVANTGQNQLLNMCMQVPNEVSTAAGLPIGHTRCKAPGASSRQLARLMSRLPNAPPHSLLGHQPAAHLGGRVARLCDNVSQVVCGDAWQGPRLSMFLAAVHLHAETLSVCSC